MKRIEFVNKTLPGESGKVLLVEEGKSCPITGEKVFLCSGQEDVASETLQRMVKRNELRALSADFLKPL